MTGTKMENVYAVVDAEKDGYVSVCDSFMKALIMANSYAKTVYDCDNVSDCENVWIDAVHLNEWL